MLARYEVAKIESAGKGTQSTTGVLPCEEQGSCVFLRICDSDINDCLRWRTGFGEREFDSIMVVVVVVERNERARRLYLL